ncbi:uncharacterized protein LOC115793679 [Archocentrus centrarchus]|uniref:uncharacterized protein LOC115793679 n=1 Tax=Archocentrus centrarchus TaxID=63155 RepID=UPI0011E9F092|nr:uncharacterized protein LOC115793679 [Archocentrus centrarchus]
MEKCPQPSWMHTVTCLNALKSSDYDYVYFACNLTKVLGQRQYIYAPVYNDSKLDCVVSSQPAFIKSESYKSRPAPGSLYKWQPVSRSANSSPLVRASCKMRSALEAPSNISQSTEVAQSSGLLKTLHQVTFSSRHLNPYVYHGYKKAGCRYLYGPPSEISGFVDEGFPPCTQICPDEGQPSSLENEELDETSSCTKQMSLQMK